MRSWDRAVESLKFDAKSRLAPYLCLYLPTPVGYGRSIVNLGRLEFMWIPLILHALAWVFAGLAFLKIRE
jgi:hypothetical protein